MTSTSLLVQVSKLGLEGVPSHFSDFQKTSNCTVWRLTRFIISTIIPKHQVRNTLSSCSATATWNHFRNARDLANWTWSEATNIATLTTTTTTDIQRPATCTKDPSLLFTRTHVGCFFSDERILKLKTSPTHTHTLKKKKDLICSLAVVGSVHRCIFSIRHLTANTIQSFPTSAGLEALLPQELEQIDARQMLRAFKTSVLWHVKLEPFRVENQKSMTVDLAPSGKSLKGHWLQG